MSVIVDTSVWSLALRRRTLSESSPAVTLLQNLITDDRVVLLGAIRQEILSGVRSSEQFTRLRDYLRAFPNLELTEEDSVDRKVRELER
jgi:predicted nucleic acid-binding protein